MRAGGQITMSLLICINAANAGSVQSNTEVTWLACGRDVTSLPHRFHKKALRQSPRGLRKLLEHAMIKHLEEFPENVVAFVCQGHVTKDDYATVLVPAVEKALKQHDKIKLYYETASDFAGIDPGAVWEDTKVGMTHLLRWERIAVVTDVDWIRHTMKVFGFLMPAELRVFPASEAAQARQWIVAK
jgi:hypothetical protein